jgi:NADPH:quinone reductase-like Zn-dependent oxidoreductase
MAPFITSMRAWQYHTASGGVENNLKLNEHTPLPSTTPDQHLVQVIALALNPIDYKPAETPLVGRFMIPKPATPGIDFTGRIIKAAENSELKVGDLVFGASGTMPPFAGGALREFAIAGEGNIVKLPEGLSPFEGACIPVAGLTALQSIVPRVKKGDRVFINGGSGGVGGFGIQIAKEVGCHVTTTCSTANVELCKSLGADEVIDYKKYNVLQVLMSREKFDHVVDNVGMDKELYWRAHEYLKENKVFILVAQDITLDVMQDQLKRRFLPVCLGGLQRKVEGFFPMPKVDDLNQLGRWMQEGVIKPTIDNIFEFEEAPKAFERLRTKRAQGKIIIDIASKNYQELKL